MDVRAALSVRRWVDDTTQLVGVASTHRWDGAIYSLVQSTSVRPGDAGEHRLKHNRANNRVLAAAVQGVSAVDAIDRGACAERRNSAKAQKGIGGKR